jgi:hypothetical protein
VVTVVTFTERNYNSTNVITLMAKFDKEVKSLYMIEAGSWLSLLASSEQDVLATYVVHVHLCIRQNGEVADASLLFTFRPAKHGWSASCSGS